MKTNMKSSVVNLTVSAVMLSLVGCMSMPTATMYKMSQLSILGINPNEISVAIRTNELIELQNGAVEIGLTTQSKGFIDGSTKSENHEKLSSFDYKYKFPVQVLDMTSVTGSPLLYKGMQDGERITILKLSKDDADLMTDAINRVKNYKSQGVKVTGGISIGTNSHCFKNLDKFEELEVDLFLKTDVKDGFMLFLDDIDIIEEAKELKINFTTNHPCQPAQ
ncbi:MAG: hypothetical protein ABJK37_11755 [Paraglaciecola sp.]|uniref:hypothetical protein n=1 Tax=Paraglaciecola sp. TaxID=1920173 RepID=UPI003298C73A